MLYDLHPRRAATCTLRAAAGIFRASEFGGRVRETSAASSSSGKAAVVGRKQLALAKCACVQERKASQCDCEQCTQITLSLSRLHRARPGWHSAFAVANGGKGCTCPLHDYSPQAAAAEAAAAAAVTATSEAAARQADAAVWERHTPESTAAQHRRPRRRRRRLRRRRRQRRLRRRRWYKVAPCLWILGVSAAVKFLKIKGKWRSGRTRV